MMLRGFRLLHIFMYLIYSMFYVVWLIAACLKIPRISFADIPVWHLNSPIKLQYYTFTRKVNAFGDL